MTDQQCGLHGKGHLLRNTTRPDLEIYRIVKSVLERIYGTVKNRITTRAASNFARNAGTAVGSRIMARLASGHITLPEPSHILFKGASR